MAVKKKASGPARQELIERFSMAIRRSQNTSEAFDERVAAALGINRTDLRGLDILSQRGAITAGDLAQAMHLTSGAITALVDRLERAGYARRVRDTEDRRRVLVELAPAARSAESFYAPLYHGTVRLLESVSDDEIRLMCEFLERGREMVEAELEKIDKSEPRPQA